MSDEICHDYREDLSHLVPLERWTNMMHIFEPLDDLITEEDLKPYCWGGDRISFFYWYDRDRESRNKVTESAHHWRSGDRVGVDGEPYELLSSRCVHRQGQWCMRWLAKRLSHRIETDDRKEVAHA